MALSRKHAAPPVGGDEPAPQPQPRPQPLPSHDPAQSVAAQHAWLEHSFGDPPEPELNLYSPRTRFAIFAVGSLGTWAALGAAVVAGWKLFH